MMLSVVIPTLNAELNLADCLERMKEADEIVVVDGGSTDETISVAEQLGARFLSAPRGEECATACRRRGSARRLATLPACGHASGPGLASRDCRPYRPPPE